MARFARAVSLTLPRDRSTPPSIAADNDHPAKQIAASFAAQMDKLQQELIARLRDAQAEFETKALELQNWRDQELAKVQSNVQIASSSFVSPVRPARPVESARPAESGSPAAAIAAAATPVVERAPSQEQSVSSAGAPEGLPPTPNFAIMNTPHLKVHYQTMGMRIPKTRNRNVLVEQLTEIFHRLRDHRFGVSSVANASVSAAATHRAKDVATTTNDCDDDDRMAMSQPDPSSVALAASRAATKTRAVSSKRRNAAHATEAPAALPEGSISEAQASSTTTSVNPALKPNRLSTRAFDKTEQFQLLRALVEQDSVMYQKLLLFQPVGLDEFERWATEHGVACSAGVPQQFLDLMGCTYRGAQV